VAREPQARSSSTGIGKLLFAASGPEPSRYRLLEISPAFNGIELQKAQNAAILLVVPFAGELNP